MVNPLMHLVHAAVVTVVLYLLMKFVLKQSDAKSMTRSVVIGLVAALYMVLFGHGAPNKLNHNLL